MFVDDMGYGDVGFNGNPVAKTPTIDKLAASGAIMTSWYTGAGVCTASRSSMLTGRQYVRLGVPNVYRPTDSGGLPPNETILAEYLKAEGYATGMFGKWHLGQRKVFLPGSRGFDEYLGIPFSCDMGFAKLTPCSADEPGLCDDSDDPNCNPLIGDVDINQSYPWLGNVVTDDWGAMYTPLLHQWNNQTHVAEQPVDLTYLAHRYHRFAREFIRRNAGDPFFLYLAFSHVHATWDNLPGAQYASCMFRGKELGGKFGDCIAELDWIIKGVVDQLRDLHLMDDTMIIFTSDNGPWLSEKLAAGSMGTFYGSYSGYWNTGKGSTWEGGIRMPAFVFWPGKIHPRTKITTVVSSLDILPTLLDIAGAPIPNDIDGHSFKDIILDGANETHHEFLFFYWAMSDYSGFTAARWKQYKIHWRTAPGVNSCCDEKCKAIFYDYRNPLVFDVDNDPAETWPVTLSELELKLVIAAYLREKKTMVFRPLYDYPGEPPFAVCCDREPWGPGNGYCNCTLNKNLPRLRRQRSADVNKEEL